MALNIVRVNALPETVAASTIYLVKGSVSDVVEIYVTSEDGLQVRHVPTKDEVRVAMSANAIDLAAGNLFTKTISGATTFTVSNVPSVGTAANFILELTNAGSAVITWFSGVKWAGGTAPTLTASGVDVLGFYSHDGGATWRGFLLSKDSK